ncbi:MAG TPA: SDR family NAD(P)-dependent oxidoreductase, partial [Bacteroidales bacterium]|nr:SDR family NAD(P)-dependent oxidoreductase [Bacteroidales bacterium]
MKLLKGKTAVITGASRGIGKAIALKYASEGADIAFTDIVENEDFAETVRSLEAHGVKAKGYVSDASKLDASEQVVEKIIADFGKIDILVNNAGITRDTLLMRMTEQQWDLVLTVNLKSVFNLTKAASKYMMKQK